MDTFATSILSSIDGCTASCDAQQQTMIGTSLQKYLEAVCTFSNQLLHGVLQITTHITSHCILHQCLNQGICSCTCLIKVCKWHQHQTPVQNIPSYHPIRAYHQRIPSS